MIVRRSKSNSSYTDVKASPSYFLTSQTKAKVIFWVKAEDKTNKADDEEREVGDDV
jgi:hypothetical protein